jgi:intracellular septation protein
LIALNAITSLMKFLLDLFPILLFFGAYKLTDIYTATAVLMVATAVQTIVMYARERKLATMQKITVVLVMGFGALTLGLHDERFIKWKPTLLYTGLALALVIGHWVMKKNLLKTLLDSQLTLPNPVWHRLNLSWMLYCLFMASINGYVAAYFSTEAWVNFKLWGYVFPLVFIVAQGFYIARHLPKEDETT